MKVSKKIKFHRASKSGIESRYRSERFWSRALILWSLSKSRYYSVTHIRRDI